MNTATIKTPTAPGIPTRPSKFDAGKDVDAKITKMVSMGLSVQRIAIELMKNNIKVSAQAVHARIQELGLVLANKPVATRTGAGSWLSCYRDSIESMATNVTGAKRMTYVEIWDELVRLNPEDPHFARSLTAASKTSILGSYIRVERKKLSRPPGRVGLFDALPNPDSKTQTVPGVPPGSVQYVYVQGSPGITGLPTPAVVTPPLSKTRTPLEPRTIQPVSESAAGMAAKSAAIPESKERYVPKGDGPIDGARLWEQMQEDQARARAIADLDITPEMREQTAALLEAMGIK